MSSSIMELLEIFDGNGAFIFVHRQGHPIPEFDIASGHNIITAGIPYRRCPDAEVLFVMDDLLTNEAQRRRTVETIVNDCSVITVYAQSVELAEQLASEARRMSLVLSDVAQGHT
ncbi:uncharacterized protein F5147DRAFT_771143 [Suillus discolor]|uniref:Uncharacterized protein n=1 Tax=Suillus discolor TaxID=1912936 RepID=A0A9P7FAR9_9AGAM|nr:uncharacterized protein F5147DRAFT_771143 [Suillus discolor]KAG2112602.1 hypothetical protein F5147DRAFT_771143 [Suillus discolor]